ncbi:AAA family ATPase [Streptomyces sp. NBC_00659]|uniref:BTAD domain-containing putative transcriptional regulator n=1 Tax=Streptomyces sp. NBC_00659 TaxID=2903669 RepID=UPI002E2F9323|nr:BTAD domain-containing putative transcriptional regulator [Streptomyces sp. NBC_00659]
MLRIRVLGSMGAEVEGRPVELGTPRQRAVLALLVTARGTVVSADQMVDAVWHGLPPAKASSSLYAYVSNLRRLLEPRRPSRAPSTVLATSAPGYVLRLPPGSVDAWSFESRVGEARKAPPGRARELLADALRSWQGPPFLEHAGETWAAPEVARLTELYVQARELSAAADLREGHANEAALAAEDLVRENPLREEGWRLLTLAHWACGRQADALASLRRAAKAVRDELGCDPSPALAELEQAVLTQRLDVLPAHVPLTTTTAVPGTTVAVVSGTADAPAATADIVSDPAPVPEPAASARLPFVGRGDELRALGTAATAARQSGSTALVTGEAGAGKSALLERFAERLRTEGWFVLIGRCPEYEGAPPAWAWVEALETLARTFPPAQPAELAALLSESDAGTAPTGDAATVGRFRMHRAFAAWLRDAAGRQPLAVFLEDLHRADAETLALFEAAAAVTGRPVFTAASYRPAEAGDLLGKTLAHLAPSAPHRITLGGLPTADVATLVETVCGEPVDPATVTALTDRTGGNPFYVLESARLLTSEGALVAVSEVPQGVRDVLRRRLALLSADARSVIQLIAVVGLEADISLLTHTTDMDEDSLLHGLEAALTADLLTEPAPGRVRFVHALVRDTVYTDVPVIRRSRLHDRVARQLRNHRPADLPALAHHFARAGRSDTAALALDYALRAAEMAERRYAHDMAVGLIQQALQAHATIASDSDGHREATVGLLIRLLGAQVRAGASDAARRTRQQAVDLAILANRDDLVAAVYGAWTEPSLWRSRLEGFFDRTALARLEQLAQDRSLDDPTRTRVLQVLVDAVAAEDAPRALEVAHAQLALARAGSEPRLLASALMTSARLMPHEGQHTAREPLVAELRQLALAHDLPAYHWVCEHLDTLTAAARNDPDRVRRHTADGLRLAHRYRLLWAQGINTLTLAMLAAVEGRYAEAETAYVEADVLLRRIGAHRAADRHTMGLMTIRLTQGRTAEIEQDVREIHSAVGAPVAVLHALVLARLGRADEARAVSFPERPVTDHLYGLELDYRSELAVLLNDTGAAAMLITHLLPLQDQFGGAAGGAYASRPLAHALADLYRLVDEEQAAADCYTRAEQVARAWHSAHHVDTARLAAAALPPPGARRRTFAP